MKIVKYRWVAACFVIGCPLKASSTISSDLAFFREFATTFYYDVRFGDQGEFLPKRWDEIQVVDRIERGGEVASMRLMNKLALVPGCPAIRQDLGVSREHVGRQLFAITRFDTADSQAGNGRYAILIKKSEGDDRINGILACFIPSREAEIILNQVANFDPQTQPVAFQDVDERAAPRKVLGVEEVENLKIERARKEAEKRRVSREAHVTKFKESRWFWMLGGSVSILLIAAFALRKLRNSHLRK